MAGDIGELQQARRVVHDETQGWCVEAEVYRKDWPADQLIFIKLKLDDLEEYVLIGPGSSEAAVRKCIQATIRRLWKRSEEVEYGVRRRPRLP